MKTQRGFTLIELVVVIIILGVLAAVAVPKFIDLSSDAHTASAKGVAGALASGSAINYAAKAASNASAITLNAANVCDASLQNLLTGTSVTLSASAATSDDTFQVSGTGDCSGAATNVVCSITAKSASAVPATILCAR